jgi:hypothetical protein
MRKVLISIAAVGAALAAAPSMAQSWGGPGGGYGQPGYGNNTGYGRPGIPSPWQIRDLVERAIQRGDVSRGDARELREDVRDLIRLDRRARSDGFNPGRQREVERKSQSILRDLRDARRDGDRDGYGRGRGGPQGDWREPEGGRDGRDYRYGN